MRPIRVEFQAFGPYVGYESVDFSKMSEKGLFLICGKTGTGKTTILDAITFALFGKSSGSGRDSFESMRCTNALDDTDTFVKFEFENNGDYFIFERRLEKKRKNFSKVFNAAKMDEDGAYVPFFENAKEKNLNEKAEEIIGLDYEQFIQVIVLPQGKFEKLLTSNSNEKEEILTSIFGEDKWQKIAEYVFAEAMERINGLKTQRDRIEQSLADENCSSLAELQTRIENKKEELNKITLDFERLNYDRKLEKQQELLTLAGRFESLRRLEESVTEYELQKSQCEQWEQKYNDAIRAEKVRPLISNLESAKKLVTDRNNELELCKLTASNFLKSAEDVKIQYDEYLKQEFEIQNQNTIRIQYEDKRNSYSEIDEAKKELKQMLAKEQQINEALSIKKESYEAFTPIIENMTAQWEKLNAELDDYLKHYIAGISGVLAEQLSDNEPCPVCGSTSHPRKAVKTTDSVTEAELNKKKKEQDDKYSELQSEIAKQQKAKQEYENTREQAQQISKDATALNTRYLSLKEKMVEGIDTYADLCKKIDELKTSITTYQSKKEKLEREYKQAADMATEARAKIEPAEKELAKATECRAEAHKELRQGLIENEFLNIEELEAMSGAGDVTDFKTCGLHNDISEAYTSGLHNDIAGAYTGSLHNSITGAYTGSLHNSITGTYTDGLRNCISGDQPDGLHKSICEVSALLMSDTDRNALKSQIDDYKAGYKQAIENLESLKSQLKDAKQPDINECREAINEINAKKTEYAEATTALKLQIQTLSDKYANLTNLGENIEERLKEAENDYAFAKSLRGDTGTGLQRYVLGIMFSSVVAAANQMLEMVHDGRYRLFRTDEKAQGSNKRGLELKVYDRYSEESDGRFVNTLSGGEKFLASLALSIGMSAVAQKSGIKIEALFIDEGFGSLDEDSIGDAMNILNSIQEANGLVGIISHVQLLQDRIPTKLRVVEADRGSHIVQTVG